MPVGSAADDDLFVTPTTQAETEVWKKGGTGQGTGNGTSMTAGQIRDALESLTATSRLDASAIQNLPTTQTAAQIRNALGGLTGSDRLDASAIQNLPSGGTPGADGADGLSAYQIWLNAGNTGTEQDFLDSLVGPQGTTGATGSVSSSSSLILNQIATPSNPGTGKVAVYAKSDGKIYKLQTGGVEEAIGTGSPQGGREVLTANRTYYVRTDGSDFANGLTNTPEGAFATWTKAINVYAALDQSIYDVAIQGNTGTHTPSSTLIIKKAIGSGKLILQGSTTTASDCILSGTMGANFLGSDGGYYLVSVSNVTNVEIKNMQLNCNQNSNWSTSLKTQTSSVILRNLIFNQTGFDANGYTLVCDLNSIVIASALSFRGNVFNNLTIDNSIFNYADGGTITSSATCASNPLYSDGGKLRFFNITWTSTGTAWSYLLRNYSHIVMKSGKTISGTKTDSVEQIV